MNIIKKSLIIRIAAAFAVAIVVYFAINLHVFFSLSNSVSDSFYQQPGTPDSRIVIIGIDEKALDEYGNLPWNRDIIAKALMHLNADNNAKPAVIGIDLLLTDESENDDMLLEICEQSDNIVMASYAQFGTELINVTSDTAFYLDNYWIEEFHPPFSALNEHVMHGHVNAMLDTDGVLRHAIWQIDLPNGQSVPSFSKVIAESYLQTTEQGILKAPITDARHRWYVVQQAVPGAYYDGISITDIVNGEVSSSYFKDKIVLIGPYASGLYDFYQTPISMSQKMFGVEYQANAISALLNEETVYYIPLDFTATITAILIFIYALFCYRRKFITAVVALIISCALWVVSSLFFFNMGYMLQILYYPLFAFIVFVLFVGINYTFFSMEKAQIAKTFERYVAPQIVKELLENDKQALQLGGRLCDIAVIFADIRQFTSLTEKLPPKKTVEIVNSYLSVFSESVFKHEGTLDKFIGDCIMAFWGAPLPQKDTSYKAVLTGIEILKQTQAFSQKFEKELGVKIEIGIGIAFGPAVVGNIGGGKRMDYTVIGDTVNTASRLENAAHGGEIFVDKNVIDNLDGRFEYEKINDIKLKGKAEDFEFYKLKFDL